MKIHRAILVGLALLTICWPLAAQASDNGKVNVGHKVGHFTVGFGVAWGCGLAGKHKTGLAIGIGLGLAKEWYDNRYHETWVSQKRDILITSAGALLGYLVAKHYYPDGMDFDSRLSFNTMNDQMNWDRQRMAEFKAWEVQYGQSVR